MKALLCLVLVACSGTAEVSFDDGMNPDYGKEPAKPKVQLVDASDEVAFDGAVFQHIPVCELFDPVTGGLVAQYACGAPPGSWIYWPASDPQGPAMSCASLPAQSPGPQDGDKCCLPGAPQCGVVKWIDALQ